MRQRSTALLFGAALACLTVVVLNVGPGRLWGQQGPLRPVPSAPPYPYSSPEPPLAGVPAAPQAAPATPAYPPIRPVPVPVAPATVGPRRDPPVPVVSIQVEVAASAAANQELEYRLCVQNRSQAPAHHVLVRDPLPANAQFVRAVPEPSVRAPELQWALGTLPAGVCKNITLVLRPTGSGDVQNCARVQFEHGECVTTHIMGAAPRIAPNPPKVAALTLQKIGPREGTLLNKPLEYQVSVCNTGGTAATAVKLTDTLPLGLEPMKDSTVAGAPQISVDTAGRSVLRWDVGTLSPGKCHTVTYRAVAKRVGRLTNTAVVTAAGGIRQQAESTVNITQPKVSLDGTGPATRYVKTPTTYVLTVRNTGSATLNHVVLQHPMPPGTTYLRGSRGARFDGTAVCWALGSLQPGATCKVQLTWQTPQPGKISVHPVVSADPGQRAQADLSTEFVAGTGLSLTVDDTDDPVEIHEKTTYKISVMNQGQVPATHVRVVAVAPAEEQIIAPTGATHFQLDPTGHTITFEPLTLAPGQRVDLEVPVVPLKSGDARFHVTMTADQLTSGQPVVAEESTTIYQE